MKTDLEILDNVKSELRWDARLNGSDVMVTVNNGHVILTGNVISYPKKINAEKAARMITGVKSVTNELKVDIPLGSKRTDTEIAKSVLNVIKWNSTIDENKIKVSVKDGWVTLEGETDWEYQRSKARILAEDSIGVIGVTNLISVVSNSATPSDIESRIEAALKRNHYLNTNEITIEVDNGKAILTGKVHTIAEKEAVETAAWSSPGITVVVNELIIDYPELFV